MYREHSQVKIVGSSARDFIDDIAKATEPLEETVENVRIDADEDMAQVWFDYRVHPTLRKTSHFSQVPEGECQMSSQVSCNERGIPLSDAHHRLLPSLRQSA